MPGDIDPLFEPAVKRHRESLSAPDGPTAFDPLFSQSVEHLRKIEALSKEELEEVQGKALHPEWNTYREALDSVSNGQLTRGDWKAARAQAEWRRENPGEAIAAQTLPVAAFMTLASTAAGRAAMTASRLAGAPVLGEVLTGEAGAGVGGVGGVALRAGVRAVSGGLQDLMTRAAYPGGQAVLPMTGNDSVDNLLTGMGMGAGGELATRFFGGPLRNSISPETAKLVRAYQNEGMPVKLSSVPGASWAARTMGRVMQMGRGDAQALTKRMIQAAGGNDDKLNGEAIENARANVSPLFRRAAQSVGNFDSPQLRQDMGAIFQHAQRNLTDDAARSRMANLEHAMSENLINGRLDGAGYLELTQKNGMLARDAARDSPVADYARDLTDVLHKRLAQLNPSAASDIVLARNQWRNSHILEDMLGSPNKVDQEGIVNPQKVFPSAISSAGGTKYETAAKASQAAQASGNPVDIGALAQGANFLKPQPGNPLAHGGVTAGALGALGLEEGIPLIHNIAGPWGTAATAGAAGLGAAYGAGGAFQNLMPGYMEMLLRRAETGNKFIANPLIPAGEQAYRERELSPERAEREAFTRSYAKQIGIDPDQAMRVARSEGFNEYTGDSGSSFGDFQLHYGGMAGGGNAVPGLGEKFTAATGLHASDPSTWKEQNKFALDWAKEHGWTDWHGWKGDPWAGIPRITVTRRPRNTDSNLLLGGQ